MARKRDYVSEEVTETPRSESSEEDSTGEVLDRQEALVTRLIDDCWMNIQSEGKLPISVGDMIRLFQFQRDLEKERPADIIEVRWIDPKREGQS